MRRFKHLTYSSSSVKKLLNFYPDISHQERDAMKSSMSIEDPKTTTECELCFSWVVNALQNCST